MNLPPAVDPSEGGQRGQRGQRGQQVSWEKHYQICQNMKGDFLILVSSFRHQKAEQKDIYSSLYSQTSEHRDQTTDFSY